MLDEKGYTEKWIDLLSKLLGISLTFLGAQIAFWTAMLLSKEGMPDFAMITAIIGSIGNFLLVIVIAVFLVKKIKTFGRLKR